jgi:hypothetical protein
MRSNPALQPTPETGAAERERQAELSSQKGGDECMAEELSFKWDPEKPNRMFENMG